MTIDKRKEKKVFQIYDVYKRKCQWQKDRPLFGRGSPINIGDVIK